jgi:uncharacterized repeat protein (TIGR01451 family)
VFVTDLTSGTAVTERVSVSSDEQPGTFEGVAATARGAAISADGRYVAFASQAQNFTVPAQTQFFMDVFVRDRQEGTTTLASPSVGGGEADAESEGPDMSPDGRFVSFSSFASDVATGAGEVQFAFQDAIVRDRTAGTSTLVSVGSNDQNVQFGEFDTHASAGPVSGDGQVALFETNADNLSPDDVNLHTDVYAFDRRPGTDLSLTKLDEPDPVAPKGNLTYTLEARNLGSNPAPSAGIADTLPAGTTFVSASAGCTNAAGTVTCELGTLAPGESKSVTIVVSPKRTGTIVNTATVGSAVSDPDTSNNTATSTTTVAK